LWNYTLMTKKKNHLAEVLRKKKGTGFYSNHASRQTSEPVDASFYAEQKAVTERERARDLADRTAKAAKHGLTLEQYDQALNNLFKP
jgi:hypothetical protein